VHFLGVKGRAELPAYLSHLDCSLMPYRRDEWGRHGSPLKVWDYLYAGPPVAGTGYVALREFPAPLVEYAEGADDFAARVLSALEEPAGAAATRRAHARANTWEARAAQIADIVAALETPERLAA
jgi:glycosyltransferase involved in cell wall biosynthesis